MAVITTATLIVLGVTAVVGVSGAIFHYATEEERAQAIIDQLRVENEQLNAAKEHVSGIKSKLTSAKEYLTNAQNDFNNGGHIQEPPFAKSEFSSCISKIDGAIKNANNLISDFNATISQNNTEIRKQEAIKAKHN